jgi:RNA ligase
MKLADLLDTTELARLIDEHYITARQHPQLPLEIYNYTAKTQYGRHWTPETELCRGLIVDTETQEVVARPFRKFFNLGEHPVAVPDEPFIAYEKLDGSLGISYPGEDGLPAIATRGSFLSPQALWATRLLREQRPAAVRWMQAHPHMTLCVEIIHPDNRIVVDYGRREDLVLLAVFDARTGEEAGRWDTNAACGFSMAQSWAYGSLGEAMAAVEGPDFDGQEGIVVRFASGLRLKVKREEYVRLHRLVTGITPRRIWEMLKDGSPPIGRLYAGTPEGFQTWARVVVDDLVGSHTHLTNAAHADHDRIMALVAEELKRRPGYADQGDDTVRASIHRAHYASHATRTAHPDLLFTLYDGKPCDASAWRRFRPVATLPFRSADE